MTSGCRARLSWVLAAEIGDRDGQAGPVDDRGGFSIPSCRGRSDSVRSAAPFEGPDTDGVDGEPRPVQIAPGPEFVEDDAVQAGPDTLP